MGMTSESSMATVRQFYQYLDEGKFAEATALLAEDIIINEPAGLPYGGEYHGLEGAFNVFGQIGAVAELSVAHRDYLSGGNPVVLHMVSLIKSKATDETVEVDIVELVTVRDGKIAKIDIYYKDTAKVAALWPK